MHVFFFFGVHFISSVWDDDEPKMEVGIRLHFVVSRELGIFLRSFHCLDSRGFWIFISDWASDTLSFLNFIFNLRDAAGDIMLFISFRGCSSITFKQKYITLQIWALRSIILLFLLVVTLIGK